MKLRNKKTVVVFVRLIWFITFVDGLNDFSSMRAKLRLPHPILDPLHMSPAQPFDLAAELEEPPDGIVVQEAKTVDDGRGLADQLDQVVRVEALVGLLPDCQDNGVGTGKDISNVLVHHEVGQPLLVAEDAGQGPAGCRV